MNRGDIYQVRQNPFMGMNEGEPYHVFVVLPHAWSRFGMSLVCPISRTGGDHHTQLVVSLSGAGTKVQGAILCDYLREVDLPASGATFCEKAPQSITNEVITRLPPKLLQA